MAGKRKVTIGWKETVDLPDWGIRHIVAKADTGARRSAIDVKRLKLLADGQVEFEIVLDRKDRSRTRVVRCPVAHVAHVRSSNGSRHERYFVRTRLLLGEREKEIELSLVCRRSMICRMLLGRMALEGDFVVDAERKYAARPRRKLALHSPEV
jgi:hypothetical protein